MECIYQKNSFDEDGDFGWCPERSDSITKDDCRRCPIGDPFSQLGEIGEGLKMYIEELERRVEALEEAMPPPPVARGEGGK